MFKRISLLGFPVLLTLLGPIQYGPTAKSGDQNAGNDKPNAPIEVQLYFSDTPSIYQQTTLGLRVTALQDAPNTSVRIVLPKDGFGLVSGETEWHDDLRRGETRTYEVRVMPLAYGKYTISASAISTKDDYSFGKSSQLFVDLQLESSKISETNILAEPSTTESRSEQISETSGPPAKVLMDRKLQQNEQFPAPLTPGGGQIAVKGYWYYRDKNGVDQPLRDARVEIWDSDTFSSDDLLATIRTNNSGYYESANISNSDEAGGLDIYVKVFSTDDISVKVTDFSGSLYSAEAPRKDNVPDGYVDFGGRTITDTNNRMAYYIYDKIANDAWDYLLNNVGWENVYNLQVRWSPTSTTGTYYVPGGSVDLVAGDRWDIDVFLHEYGHFVMYKIYGNAFPPTPNCNPHSWGTHSSLGCAWSEGWANFLQAAIQNDRNYDDTEDQTLHIDYEPPSPFADHAEDEGAVAASLWDIFDSGSETWDSLNYGINGSSNNGIWASVSGTRPNDIIGFYNNWMSSANGFNSQVTSILQHHNVIPNPVLTASLTLTPGQPYVVGQTVTGRFSITNRGNRSITFDALTIGGRLNSDSNVVDFPSLTSVTVSANQTYQYVGNFTFNQTGNYRFFPAYKLRGEVWRIGLLNEIPADSGVTYNLNFSVGTNCSSPGAFSLSSPTNGQSFVSSTASVTLSWGQSANANSYDVYFGTNSNPSFYTNTQGTSLNVNVSAGQTYYWKVVAKVSCNSSLTSTTSIQSFSVQQVCNVPGSFSLSSPTNGQSFSSSTTSVTLSWAQSANANSYDVYFGTNSNPSFYTNTQGTSLNVNVSAGQTYYWKVVAKVSCNSSLTSTTSIQSFSVQVTCNVPGTFSLTFPSDGQSFSSSTTSATLSWGTSVNADNYDVYFGTSSNPGFIANQSATSRTVSVNAGQTYYWKIVAKVNCNSSLTSMTAVRSFSVQSPTSTTRTLTVASSNPSSGVSITVSSTDNNGQSNGTTQFTRTYNNNTNISLTAPSTAGGNNFQKWQLDGVDLTTSLLANFVMEANHTITAVYITPSIGNTASYDGVLKAPKCGQVGSSCDSGALLNGRDSITNGGEPNQPNTIYNSCADNTVGTYHSDESIDKIKISTLDGSSIGPGKTVRIDVTVWAFSATKDYLDLFYASDAANPNWQLLAASILPSTTGLQVLSYTFTLPAGSSLQAIRANFSYDGALTACGSPGTDYVDHDDLIFAVSSSAGQPFQLALEQFGPVANQALAMDATLMLRDPFPIVNSTNALNNGSDKNTRVMVYLTNFQLATGETSASVVVNLVDSFGQSFDIAAEDVRSVPNSSFTQVTFRLPSNLAAGTCNVIVKAHGQSSNLGTFRIKSSGP